MIKRTLLWSAAVAVAVSCLMGLPVAADELPTCVGIKDTKVKEDCQVRVQRRRGYGENLERKLAASGLDIKTFIEEEGGPGTWGYPRLIIWTFLTREKVDALNRESGILDDARAVGYRTLVFIDKDQRSDNWYFDLTKPGSTPMDVVAPPPTWMRRNQAQHP